MNNVKDGKDKGDKELDLMRRDKKDFLSYSGALDRTNRTKAMSMGQAVAMHQSYDDRKEQGKGGPIKETSESYVQLKDEITSVSEKLLQLTKIVQEKLERQDNETATLKKKFAELGQVVAGNDRKSLKA